MTLRERQSRPSKDYARVLIDRLHRSSLQTASFMALCDQASIPRDLRAALLRHLLDEHYVTNDGSDAITLTKEGTAVATAPLTQDHDEPPRRWKPRSRWKD